MTQTIAHDPAWRTMLIRILDLLAIISAARIATMLHFGAVLPELPPVYALLQYAAVGIAYAMFPRFGLYSGAHAAPGTRMPERLLGAWTCLLAILALLAFLVHLAASLSGSWLLYWYCAGGLMLLLVRAGIRLSMSLARRRGWGGTRVLVVGGGDVSRQLLAAARGQGRLEYTVCAWCPAPGETPAPAPAGLDALHDAGAIPGYLRQHDIDEIWIAMPLNRADAVGRLQHILRNEYTELRWFMDTGALHLLRTNMDTLFGLPLLNLNCPGTGHWNRIGKLVFDKVFALAVLMLLSPLYLAIYCGVKLSSPGPACFVQRRIGLNGAEFKVYKFRSMRLHDEPANVVVQATANDPRVTRFGAFLRRTSLDELPQFLNVLKGDMSVVGPRPHAVQHTETYGGLLDNYMLRHRAKPGITGWAQINGYRGETDTLDKMVKRVQYDLYYIRHWSLWLDLRIVLWTALRGWTGRNAY
jgi:putative colanic acid biosysnthesis UDP-glucose lipid carrier transferase